MSAGNKVQDLILKKLETLEAKIDAISTQTIPAIMTSVAVSNQQIKDEAKLTSRTYAFIWGALTLIVSCAGVAIAYFK